jgi:hypothetical protein
MPARASPKSSRAERDLLFGIPALQLDFISRDALIAAMNAWVLDKSRPLGAILIAQRNLSEVCRTPIRWNPRRHQTWMRACDGRQAPLISKPRPHVAWVSRIHRRRGRLQPRRRERIAQEVEPPTDPPDERLVGVLLEVRFRQEGKKEGKALVCRDNCDCGIKRNPV